MKATPKTDEVINVLEQAVTVINLMEHNIREIEKADIPTDEAKDVINVYQSNLDYCHSWKVTAKDVYDEYWEICLNVDSLPKCAKAMAVRFENVGIPVWVCDPHSDYIKQISNKIWRMEQQGVITKSQASDLMCLFDLLAKWVMVWVFRVQNILKEMGVEPLPILTDKSEETGEEESDKPTADIANKIHGKAGQDKNTQVIEAQSISPEPQPLLTNKLKETGDETKNKPTPLPEVLNTNEAKSILQKAINAGFCDANYQWGKTKALLAYFADRVSEYLELGKGEYDGKAKTSWKPFESLFGISGLSGAKRDYQKTGTLPDGYKDVDTLFE